jgi:hypothetical protein
MHNTKVIQNFETFPERTNIPHPTNDSEVMITEVGRSAAGKQLWID